MAISMEQIRDLRAQTGAGIVDVKEALTESGGDAQKAITWLREKGKATAAKKADRETKEGVVGVYVHGNNKIAAMVSLSCETDFVARTERFQELARDLAMHVAALDPLVVNPADMPEAEVEAERELAMKQGKESGKPEEIVAKMVEGKLKKFKEERALMTQSFVKDPNQTVEQLVNAAIQELGENITIQSFTRQSI